MKLPREVTQASPLAPEQSGAVSYADQVRELIPPGSPWRLNAPVRSDSQSAEQAEPAGRAQMKEGRLGDLPGRPSKTTVGSTQRVVSRLKVPSIDSQVNQW